MQLKGKSRQARVSRWSVIATLAGVMAFSVTGAAPGGAASKGGPRSRGGVSPQSTGCFKTFTNAGPPSLSVCVSNHGNINQITYDVFGSTQPYIEATPGFVSEGYCLRRTDLGSVYYDRGDGEVGWGAASASVLGNTMTVTRTTTDGVFTLTQNIFFKYGSRMVLIGNIVKNNSPSTLPVQFGRYFKGDVGGTITNVYDVAGYSASGEGAGHGLMLTGLTPGEFVTVHGFGNLNTNTTTCLASNSVTTPTPPGDYGGMITAPASIPSGGTVNFKVGYRLM